MGTPFTSRENFRHIASAEGEVGRKIWWFKIKNIEPTIYIHWFIRKGKKVNVCIVLNRGFFIRMRN